MSTPLLSVENLTQHFAVTRGTFGKVVGHIRAVDGVSFTIEPGETLGLVGESGCGKTTVGRAVLRLSRPTSGRVVYDGTDVTAATPEELVRLRRHMQIVFQDPFGSLNPRLRVRDIVGEALEVHGIARGPDVDRRVAEVLSKVGIPRTWMNRYPHEFSGGQRQRIGIARAIAVEPRLIVCDEAVSALDVSIQAQVINLLVDLRKEMGLSYLFIAHDLSVVRHLSHRIAVMYLGEIVEIGPAERLFTAPSHPYTRALLSAIPVPDPRAPRRRLVLSGDVPSPLNPPSGCRFHTRCPAVTERCPLAPPPVIEVEPGHRVQCVHAEGLAGAPDFYEKLSERIEARTRENGALVERPKPERHVPRRPPERTDADRARATSADWNGAPESNAHRNWIAAGLLLLLVALWPLSPWAHERSARRTLEKLSTEIEAFARNTGAPPERLSELGFRLYDLFEGGAPVDSWGRPLVYRRDDSGRGFELSSTGADGKPSADDLKLRVR